MITNDNIKKANKGLPMVDIKGKNYVMVKDRVKAFRDVFPDFAIETEIIHLDADSVTIRATIKDETGNVKATGHARELQNASFINKTSYVENCETSAIGRAIGLLGIGIDDSFGSADEVANAINQQTQEKVSVRQATVLKGMIDKYNVNTTAVLKWVGASSVDDMTVEQYAKACDAINKKYAEHIA